MLKWLDAGHWQDASTTHQLDAVGHRIVHGADRFTESVVINSDVIVGIEELEDLAPLHNAPALESIRASRDVLGSKVPMIAVFDTVFQRTIPKRARMYGLPWELARRNHIQRYGFHGISHKLMPSHRIMKTDWRSITTTSERTEKTCRRSQTGSGPDMGNCTSGRFER